MKKWKQNKNEFWSSSVQTYPEWTPTRNLFFLWSVNGAHYPNMNMIEIAVAILLIQINWQKMRISLSINEWMNEVKGSRFDRNFVDWRSLFWCEISENSKNIYKKVSVSSLCAVCSSSCHKTAYHMLYIHSLPIFCLYGMQRDDIWRFLCISLICIVYRILQSDISPFSSSHRLDLLDDAHSLYATNIFAFHRIFFRILCIRILPKHYRHEQHSNDLSMQSLTQMLWGNMSSESLLLWDEQRGCGLWQNEAEWILLHNACIDTASFYHELVDVFPDSVCSKTPSDTVHISTFSSMSSRDLAQYALSNHSWRHILHSSASTSSIGMVDRFDAHPSCGASFEKVEKTEFRWRNEKLEKIVPLCFI